MRTGGQAVDFRGPALTVLEKMGLLDQVKAGATSMGPLALVDGRGREIGRLPAEVISGEVEIHWGTLTRILYEAVRDDVNYRFGVRISALDDDGRRVNVTFSDGSTGSYDLVIGSGRPAFRHTPTRVRTRKALRHAVGSVFRVLRRRKPFAA